MASPERSPRRANNNTRARSRLDMPTASIDASSAADRALGTPASARYRTGPIPSASCRPSRPSRNIHRSNARNAVAATASEPAEPAEQRPERHPKNRFTSRTVNPTRGTRKRSVLVEAVARSPSSPMWRSQAVSVVARAASCSQAALRP